MTTIEQINAQIDELMRRRRVMEAAKDGKRIESLIRFIDSEWRHCPVPVWDWAHYDYRIAPEPKVVPWTRADVPFIAMYRRNDVTDPIDRFPVEKGNTGLKFHSFFVSYETLAELWNCSTDGTNWKPCYKHANNP